MSGDKRIDVEEHSTKDNKDQAKIPYNYFYTKENKVIIQGSDINLEILIENYLYNLPYPRDQIPTYQLLCFNK